MLFLIDIPRRHAVVPSIVFESAEKIKRLYTVDLDKKTERAVWYSFIFYRCFEPLFEFSRSV